MNAQIGSLSSQRSAVVIIITAQLHLIKPEFKLCVGSNLSLVISDICSYEELSFYYFRLSTIPPKQFLVIIIIQFDKLPIQFNLINFCYDVVLLEITQMFHHTIAAPIFNEFFFTNVINQWMKFCKKIKNKISFIDYDNYLLNLT